MNIVEQLKAAYTAGGGATWHYDPNLSAIVRVSADKHRIEVVADFGKVDDARPKAEFIALMHNALPALLEAASVLEEVTRGAEWAAGVIGDIPPHSTYMSNIADAKAALAKLKGEAG